MAWTQEGSIRGPAGEEVELRKTATDIEWRLGTGSWTTLVALSAITGPAGEAGAGIEIAGSVATYANLPSNLGSPDAGKGYLVQADGLLYIWDGTAFPADGSGVAFQGPPGADGDNGKEIEMQVSETHIQWRYVGAGSWTNLIALASLKGDKGDAGAPGVDGKGWTGGSYSTSTGIVTFTSTDGLGFSTGDLRGADGSNGTNGADGSDGIDGTKWFTGAGSPTTVSGSKAGDLYLDTDTGAVWKLS